MSTSVFFNNYMASGEQILIEDLIIESIQIYGHDVFYLPRSVVEEDDIFNEDAISRFDAAYQIEVYIKNVDGFEGEGDFLSKFGLQIKDQITFTVARRIWEDHIGSLSTQGQLRPNEGDVIYMPMTQKFYQVSFVEHEAVFYQFGQLTTYDLVCELMDYGGAIIDSGSDYIDAGAEAHVRALSDYVIHFGIQGGQGGLDQWVDENGDVFVYEEYIAIDETLDKEYDNADFDSEISSASILDFTESDPFSEGSY